MNRSRGGIALVIALVLLAGLVLLGLPFLFSQSESLAGARNFADHQATAVGLDTAERYTVAVTADALEHHLVSGGPEDAWTRYHDELATAAIQYEDVRPDYHNLWPIRGANVTDQGVTGNHRQAAIGMWMTDEYGKLNPNYMSPAAWTRLLRELDISDWDDNDVIDSQDWADDPIADRHNDGNLDEDDVPGLDGNPDSNGDNDDGDDNGELAQALADLRYTLRGRRITDLDQLLLADPGHNRDADVGGGAYTGAAGPNGNYGFRRPLTRAELARLKPYLTLSTPAPGREGLIDLGTELMEYLPTGTSPNGERMVILDGDPWELLRTGSAATWPEVRDDEDYQFSRVENVAPQRWYGGGDRLSTAIRLRDHHVAQGRAIGIIAPPTINLHHVEDPVLKALGVSARIPATDLLGDLPDTAGNLETAFKSLSPLRLLPRLDDPSKTEWGEMQPTGIASKGILSLHAGAAKADPQNRVTAERERQTIVQTVPTQQVLEARWDYQDEFHALVLQRFTSNLDSWPEAVRRLDARKPATKTSPGTGPTGLAAATQPSLATGWRNRRRNGTNATPTHLHRDTAYTFGADTPVDGSTTAGISDRYDTGTALVNASAANLRADGLRITGNVAVRSTPSNGPLRPVSATETNLATRHLSLWFKPEADWDQAGKVYPLLSLRTDPTLVGGTVFGPGSNDLQNKLEIAYDRDRQMLVAAICPPVIEHLQDRGPQTPFDELATTFHLDERCLGDASVEAAPYTAIGTAVLHPLAPRQRYPDAPGSATDAVLWDDEDSAAYTTQASRLFKPNTVAHLLKVADPPRLQGGGDRPFFRRDRWYHLTLVLGGDRPGQVRMLIDGIAGQDVSRTPPASPDDLNTGDFLTLPAMPLATALPLLVANGLPAGGGSAYIVPSITVQPVLGLSAEDLFPKRGMIRIDDEYIAYDQVVGNTFQNCQRAQRQNTETDNANPELRWPLTQEHLAGALVVPAGYRLTPGGGTIYRGGSNLAENLGNGDPTDGWRISTKIDISATPPLIFEDTNSDMVNDQLVWPGSDPTVTTIPVLGGAIAQFPVRGIVRIQGSPQYLAYSGRTATELLNVTDCTALVSLVPTPGASPFTARDDVVMNPIPTSQTEAPYVYLVGIPLDADPTGAGVYNDTLNETVISLQHPSGRVEWIGYDWMASDNGAEHYCIASGGFRRANRGRERTDFCGRITDVVNGLTAVPTYATTALTSSHFFPAGSQVLPVQTRVGSQGHWVATGDVITLLPKNPTAQPDPLPIQAVVRYAAYDGLDTAGGDAFIDTKNEWFAFDAPLPRALNAADFEILCGPAWAGQDLTPMSPVNQPRGATIRLDYLSGGALGNVDTALFSPAPVALIPAEAQTAHDGRTQTTGVIIDALVAGNLGGQGGSWPRDPNAASGVGVASAIDGGTVDHSDFAARGRIIRLDHATLTNEMGLISLNGETFAYRQLRNGEQSGIPGFNADSDVMLIGRGLLDLTDPATPVHSLPQGPTRGGTVLTPLLDVLPLPLGPVALVNQALPDFTAFTFDTGLHDPRTSNERPKHEALDAPIALVCHPDGDRTQVTALALAGEIERHVQIRPGTWVWDCEYVLAPWLRGMYNTTPTGAGNLDDIVIGWWPRYASALPNDLSAVGDEAALLRCRRYVSAGFPVAMRNMRFDTGNPATIEVDGTLSADLIRLEARASAVRDHDWARLAPEQWLDGTWEPPGIFGVGDFVNDVNGAELRLWWRYDVAASSALDVLGESGSRTPLINSVRMRWTAPTALLSVEEAR